MIVKYTAEIDTPTVPTGYKVNGNKFVPFDEGNLDYQEVQEWIAEGNEPEPAYTQDELDKYESDKLIAIQDSMLEEGNLVNIADTNRIEVGANPIIEDKAEFNAWMKKTYDEKDGEGETLYKPPANERQMLNIVDEDADRYTFTRYQDQWGYRWLMRLKRADTTNLAVAIYDKDGNYLYTTGKLLWDEETLEWWTQCPAGQADATPKDVFFKWLLGAGDISGLQVYKGVDESTSGIVRSDPRYD